MHDLLWPRELWHYWTEERFRAHCEGHKFITLAGGASTSKSYDSGKLATLFWLSGPHKRTVVVASTTLDSLTGRIWGYITNFMNTLDIPVQHRYYSSKPPRILFHPKDTIHGMFAVAAKRGDSEASIREWIGRHPKEALLVILDEGTDMPPAILGAVANLDTAPWFQLMCIGNSSSRFDLHGILSTPKVGWDKIDPKVDKKWETTQENGICMFFSCHDSPAIHETDPVRKAKLGHFLITAEEIEQKGKVLGFDSESFYRFVLGYWKDGSTDETVISDKFLGEFRVKQLAEWSGIYPLSMVAGLDPAFSVGGDNCVLRLAVLGHTVDGDIVLDYRKDRLLFYIEISRLSEDSAEIQIAKQVLKILEDFRIPLSAMAIDANGQGRALGEVIRLQAKSTEMPIKIYSTRGGSGVKNSFDVTIKTSMDLWGAFRDYIQTDQIRGLDDTTIAQLTTRMVNQNEKTGKMQLELKREYRIRMGAISPILAKSPDEADAAVLALQAAIMKYGFTPQQKKGTVRGVDGMIDQKLAEFKRIQLMQRAEKIEAQRGAPKATFTSGLTGFKPFLGR